MSDRVLAASVAAATALACAPYLARLVGSVPDGARRDWWRGVPAGRVLVAGTAVVAAVFAVLAGYAAGWSVALPAFVALALVCAPLAVIDVRHHRLPDRLVGSGAVLGALLLGGAALVGAGGGPLARAGLAAAAVFGTFFLLALASPRSIGFGDVKLAALLGGYLGWFGWLDVLYGVFAGFVCGALAALVLLAGRRASLGTAMPFGPALIVGALLVAALGH